MGYYTLVAECLRCHQTMFCNPHRVPTIRINGIKEPLCENCFNVLNDVRIANGLEPWILPDGAYDPVPEGPEEDIN